MYIILFTGKSDKDTIHVMLLFISRSQIFYQIVLIKTLLQIILLIGYKRKKTMLNIR